MIHELKILPKYFNLILSRKKTFELRENDRDYKANDTLLLFEFIEGKYTGRECSRKVLYVLKNVESFGLKKGFAILSIN